jgi:cytochrome b involved in lipid metabolism
VILDNQVLDVEPFLPYHPGGEFALRERLGFSIDLPFNGHHYPGVFAETGGNPGHMHSNQAREIALSLVIGRYSDI